MGKVISIFRRRAVRRRQAARGMLRGLSLVGGWAAQGEVRLADSVALAMPAAAAWLEDVTSGWQWRPRHRDHIQEQLEV